MHLFLFFLIILVKITARAVSNQIHHIHILYIIWTKQHYTFFFFINKKKILSRRLEGVKTTHLEK